MSRRHHGTCRAGSGRQRQLQLYRPPTARLLLAQPGTRTSGRARPCWPQIVPVPCLLLKLLRPEGETARRRDCPAVRGTASQPLSSGIAAAEQCQGPPGFPQPGRGCEPRGGPSQGLGDWGQTQEARQVGARGKPGPEGAGPGGARPGRRGRAREGPGQQQAGPPHPVEVAGVAILPLRGQPLAERRDLADEQEGGGQQRGQRVVGSRQPAAQPGHRVQQRQQRRQHRHLGPARTIAPLLLGRPPARLREAGLFSRWPMASGAVKHASHRSRPMRGKERSSHSEA